MSSQPDFEVFAVFDDAPPRLLTQKGGNGGRFFSRLAVPLPHHLVLYGRGLWPSHSASVRLDLGPAVEPLALAALDSHHGAVASLLHLTDEQQLAVADLVQSNGMAKLLVHFLDDTDVQDRDSSMQVSPRAAGSTGTARAQSEALRTPKAGVPPPLDSGHPSPEFNSAELTTMPEASHVTASRGHLDPDSASTASDDDIFTQFTQLPQMDTSDETPAQPEEPATSPTAHYPDAGPSFPAALEPASKPRRSAASRGQRPPVAVLAAESVQPSPKRRHTHPGSTASEISQPSGRWGHSLTAVGPNAAIVFGGQGEGYDLCRDIAWHYDGESRTWASLECSGDIPPTRMGHSTVFWPSANALVVFGGAKKKRFLRDVHVLHLTDKRWETLEIQGKRGPALSYHSCTLHNNSLFIWGGNFPVKDPLPDGCSASLWVFDLCQKSWCQPITVGDVPAPRSGHAATLVDGHLIVFGGWDAPSAFNDVFRLDLTLMEFTKLSPTGTPPCPRSWMLSLPVTFRGHKAVYYHGGYDGEKALRDSFVLDLEEMAWHEAPNPFPSARAGHAAAVLGSQGFVLGGGDNEGRFFNACDALPLHLP